MKLVGMLSTALLVAAPAMVCAQAHGGMGGMGGMGGGAGRGGFSQVSTARASASWGPGFGPATAGHGAGHGGGFHGGRGFDRHGRGFHDHFHGHGAWLGWGPYWGWGWSDCGADGDTCDWGDESGPGAPSDDYGYTDGPSTEAACGAWLRHGDGYAWTRRACGDPPAADPPAHAGVAANDCSDWVWRADLHRSVCKRASRG